MIRFDSRKIQPGDTFLCLPVAENYSEEARQKGAKEIIHCTREEMARIAAEYFGNPSQTLTVIGVTGTNGKTTTTHLVAHILQQAGYKPYIIGTLSGNLTTPESIELQEIMADKLKKGYTHIVMEVSSIGVDQHRVDQIVFDIKLLTNITQDHLDYHLTFDNYRATKLFFMNNFPGTSIYPEEYLNYQIKFPLPLLGKFNYMNAQAAASICRDLGVSEETIKQALACAPTVPGRFEQVHAGQKFYVFVDYAHTPDGLQNILEGINDFKHSINLSGKIITLFGCGGNRDKTKRPLMGAIAEHLSDQVIVTSDNPRNEDPQDIIDQIITGIKNPQKIIVQPNRHDAIRAAIQLANENDIVLLAGKGHETYQIIGDKTLHFDDREQATAAIKDLPK